MSEALQPRNWAANGMKWLDDMGEKKTIVAIILRAWALWQIGNFTVSMLQSLLTQELVISVRELTVTRQTDGRSNSIFGISGLTELFEDKCDL